MLFINVYRNTTRRYHKTKNDHDTQYIRHTTHDTQHTPSKQNNNKKWTTIHTNSTVYRTHTDTNHRPITYSSNRQLNQKNELRNKTKNITKQREWWKRQKTSMIVLFFLLMNIYNHVTPPAAGAASTTWSFSSQQQTPNVTKLSTSKRLTYNSITFPWFHSSCLFCLFDTFCVEFLW